MNTYYVAGIPYTSELYHHGIKGQKWGIRRFQNPDGTLTVAGRERYGRGEESRSKYPKELFNKKNTTRSYNDHEYYAFEYQDEPNTKKVIREVINGDAPGHILRDQAKRFYDLDKQYIDLFVKYSKEHTTKRERDTGSYDENKLEKTIRSNHPDYVDLERKRNGARTLLKYFVSSMVENGYFNKVFDGHPPVSYRDDDYNSGSRIIDGRKSVIATFLASEYGTAPYGFDNLTPYDFAEWHKF